MVLTQDTDKETVCSLGEGTHDDGNSRVIVHLAKREHHSVLMWKK